MYRLSSQKSHFIYESWNIISWLCPAESCWFCSQMILLKINKLKKELYKLTQLSWILSVSIFPCKQGILCWTHSYRHCSILQLYIIWNLMHLDSSTFQLVKPGKLLKALLEVSISIKYVETIYLMDCLKVITRDKHKVGSMCFS